MVIMPNYDVVYDGESLQTWLRDSGGTHPTCVDGSPVAMDRLVAVGGSAVETEVVLLGRVKTPTHARYLRDRCTRAHERALLSHANVTDVAVRAIADLVAAFESVCIERDNLAARVAHLEAISNTVAEFYSVDGEGGISC